MKNSDKFAQYSAGSAPTSNYQVPTEIIDLPSRGKLYSEDHPLKNVETIEIKYMTTKEEDLLVSPSLNEKGIAIDRVIESLIVGIRVSASSLLPGDKNAILMAARKSAYGDEYKFKDLCTSCSEINNIIVSLNDLKIKEIEENENSYYSENGNIVVVLPKSQAKVELKILTSDDEKIIQETTKRRISNNLPGEELLTRYRRMLISVNDNEDIQFISSFISNLGIADSRFLKKKYLEMVPDISFHYSHNCSKCNALMEGGVPIGSDFFWPEIWLH